MALNYTSIPARTVTVNGFGTRNNVTISTPPLPFTVNYLFWKQGLIDYRVSTNPLARTTTYYFAQAGSDSNTGTKLSPFQTVAKAQTLINALPLNGDTAFLFNRGDIWRETGGLVSGTLNNCTIADYGTGALPFFNRFTQQYAANSGWSLSGGQTKTYQRAETNTISFFREANDLLFAYTFQSSIATVEANTGSWWWSANVLYIHPRADSNPTSNNIPYEACPDNQSTPGIGIGLTTGQAGTQADGWRVQNMRVDGFGCMVSDPLSGQKYCIGNYANDNLGASPNHNLFIGCQAYYSGGHVIAHYSGAAGSTGGHTTWINCTAGYTQYTPGNTPTIFNTYSDAGNQESIFQDCICEYGTAPNVGWYNATTAPLNGFGFFGHCATVGNKQQSLTVYDRCTIRANKFGAQCGARYLQQKSPTIAIQAISWAGNVVSVQCNAHGYTTGQFILIRGVTGSIVSDGYNGYYSITVVDANNFTYAQVTNPGTSSGSSSWTATLPDINAVRCFKTRETIEKQLGNGLTQVMAETDAITVSQYADLFPVVANSMYGDGGLIVNCLGGWWVNSIWKIDISQQTAQFAVFNSVTDEFSYFMNMWHSHIEVSNAGNNFQINFRTGVPGLDNTVIKNCILSKKSGTGLFRQTVNNAAHLINNAYYSASLHGNGGYDADASYLTLDGLGTPPQVGIAPLPDSPLYRRGQAITSVTADFYYNTRPSNPTVGPIEVQAAAINDPGIDY